MKYFFLFQAKLPRGIENILSHIENVDNVPLQVPLFTDCNIECKQWFVSALIINVYYQR